MPHEDVHYNIGAGSYQSCICTCRECWNDTMECICEGCSCTNPERLLPLHPAYTPIKPVVSHPCKSCGKEVVRKGNRGRWPANCVGCKK